MKKILLLLLFILFYHFSVESFSLQHFLPSLHELLAAFQDNLSGTDIYNHVFSSLSRILVGFSIATLLGVSMGIVVGYSDKLKDIFFFIDLLRPIPPIAWIPIAIIIFGLGNPSSYFIVFLGAFFPIFSNTYFGASTMPKILKNCAATFEIGRFNYLYRILFYYSLPYIFTGMKIGMGMAWMSVIASELIGAQSGLGYFIQLNRLLLKTDNIIVGMVLIGIIGYLLQTSITLLEKRVVRWR